MNLILTSLLGFYYKDKEGRKIAHNLSLIATII